MLNPHEIGALAALVNQDRSSEAEYRTRALLRTYPDAGMLWKILSVALLRQGKDALPALLRAAELMPQDAEAHSNLGAALHDRGAWAEALASLERALAIEPRDADALVHAADAMKELGRAQDAVPLYHRALRLDPRHVHARNNLGNAFLRLGQYADAIGYYRLALEIKPDDAQILCNLGNAQRCLGYLDEALASTQRALAQDPASSMAHNHLGLIHAASGNREAAIASYRQALILNSHNVEALCNLAGMLRDLGYRRDAAALYARAIQADPGRAESHCGLGMALFELRRIDDAVAGFRQALALPPDYAAAHLNLGLAMRQQRRPAEAEASCRAALAIDPDYVDALVFLGELRADHGQFAEAEALFQRALAIKPDFAPALSSLAAHRKMTVEDADWVQRAAALLTQQLPLANEISLRYSLGKYFDDIERHDDAFDQYVRANELGKLFRPAYDGAKLADYVDRIMRSFDAEFLRQHRNAAAGAASPIFIIGMPRSGTSLAEQILASHPAVFGAGEVPFWNTAYQAYREAERKVSGTGASLIPDKAREYLDLLASLSGGKERVVDKLPANFLYAGLIHAALPQARFIHMRRHPIDTCLSIYFQNFFHIGPYASDLRSLAHYYREYVRITDHWRRVLPATALLEVPYEGLLEDQEGWSRRMLEFAGLPWDPRCLDFDRTERVVITTSKWQVRQKIDKSAVGRSRRYERFLGPLAGLKDLIAGESAAVETLVNDRSVSSVNDRGGPPVNDGNLPQ